VSGGHGTPVGSPNASWRDRPGSVMFAPAPHFFSAVCPRCAQRFLSGHKLLILRLFLSQSVQFIMGATDIFLFKVN
jgi:hypothetical protein